MFSFRLTDTFLEKYRSLEPDWGFKDAGGNSLGELTFVRTYSRVKEDGTKERWWEVCERVINGMYSIQKDWSKDNSLPWNDRKAHASAQEAYDRLFNFKWTPPGRGLWMMGTPFVMQGRDGKKNGSALQNCAVVSTADLDRHDPGALFYWVMDALMLGVGVGWDTLGSNKDFEIYRPSDDKVEYIVPDSREGWADSVRVLINSYLKPNQHKVRFDYSQVRPYGAQINGFGGTASGPDPLIKVHDQLSQVFERAVGGNLDSVIIADIMNLIGTCVVAGNVRRSAELGLGQPDDDRFINLKNPEVFPERNSYDPSNPGWAWMSNNSLSVTVGTDYEPFVDRIVANGEPGFVWLDVARNYGRLIDGPTGNDDGKVVAFNPCAEQQLESYEMCTLVELHINRAESREDFLRSLKFAFLYGKTVTLLSTHWEKTNAVMQKNRRIGLSITGMAGFVDDHGLPELRNWWDDGYKQTQYYDRKYSEWLGVRESKRTTSVKPSGSVSLLSGATPGVHWPSGGSYYMRAIRLADDSPLLPELQSAGYKIEKDLVSANTKVVYFPVKAGVKRGEKKVSIFEKIALAAEAQSHWADNSVSVTVTFDAEKESQYVDTVLKMYEGKLKTVSFLPMGNEVYPQQPYTEITQEEYESWIDKLGKISWEPVYALSEEAAGDKYCTTDACEIPKINFEEEK